MSPNNSTHIFVDNSIKPVRYWTSRVNFNCAFGNIILADFVRKAAVLNIINAFWWPKITSENSTLSHTGFVETTSSCCRRRRVQSVGWYSIEQVDGSHVPDTRSLRWKSGTNSPGNQHNYWRPAAWAAAHGHHTAIQNVPSHRPSPQHVYVSGMVRGAVLKPARWGFLLLLLLLLNGCSNWQRACIDAPMRAYTVRRKISGCHEIGSNLSVQCKRWAWRVGLDSQLGLFLLTRRQSVVAADWSSFKYGTKCFDETETKYSLGGKTLHSRLNFKNLQLTRLRIAKVVFSCLLELRNFYKIPSRISKSIFHFVSQLIKKDSTHLAQRHNRIFR